MAMDPNAAVFALSLGGVPVIDKSDLLVFAELLKKNGYLSINKMVRGGQLVGHQVENKAPTFVFGVNDNSANKVQYITWRQGFNTPQPNILRDMFPDLDRDYLIPKLNTNLFL